MKETKTIIMSFLIRLLVIITVSFIIVSHVKELPVNYTDNSSYKHVNGQPLRRIPLSSIHEYSDKIVIDCDNCILSGYSPTGSMEPTLNEAMYGISKLVEGNCSGLVIGDIVTYQLDSIIYGCSDYTHRIIDIKNDEHGWYAVTKGDNLPEHDLIKIRCEIITQVLVGVVY